MNLNLIYSHSIDNTNEIANFNWIQWIKLYVLIVCWIQTLKQWHLAEKNTIEAALYTHVTRA
jgi:hypothetical protein